MKRNNIGRFKVKCSARDHENVGPGSEEYLSILSINNGRKIRLEDDGIIARNARGSICKQCLDSVIEDQPESTDAVNFTKLVTEIKTDIKNFSRSFEFHELASFDGKAWFTNRPKDLQSLMLKLCGINDLLFVTDKQFLTLSKIVELIYGLHKSNLIAPLSFAENLLTHKMSGSKQLVTYNSRLSPAGSYFYVNEWLNKKAEKALSFPSGTLTVSYTHLTLPTTPYV